jgi:hypothetical protein
MARRAPRPGQFEIGFASLLDAKISVGVDQGFFGIRFLFPVVTCGVTRRQMTCPPGMFPFPELGFGTR